MVKKEELVEEITRLEEENKILKSNQKNVLTIQDIMNYVEFCDNNMGCNKCTFMSMCNGITTLSERRNPSVLIEYLKNGKRNKVLRAKRKVREESEFKQNSTPVKKRGRGRPRKNEVCK